MQIKNIVSFGCSWPHGIELIDPQLKENGILSDDPANDTYRLLNSYPGLIASHYGWTLDDRTKTDTRLPYMLVDFSDWLAESSIGDQMQSLVLIGLTHETGTDTKQEDIVFEKVVAAFDALAAEHRIPMLQFNVLARQHKLRYPTLIESSSALEMLVIRDKPRKSPLFAEYKHPNEKGHLILSEFLIDKIDSVIINE